MRNRVLIPSLIALIAIVFIYGLLVGVYKIFPYEPLNSSFDVIKGETPIQNDNQFIIQDDLDSLIKINNESELCGALAL